MSETKQHSATADARRPSGWVPRRTTVDQARMVSFEALYEVATRDAYANLLLPKLLKQAGLNGRDAGFATELTYGVLRNQGFLDAILRQCITGGELEDLEIEVLILLRMGAFQLLKMRVPDHAAVSETVNQTRQVLSQGPSKLVNAVLRRVSEKDLEAWTGQITRENYGDYLSTASVKYSLQPWQTAALQDALNSDGRTFELEKLLAANISVPPVSLVARPGLISVKKLTAQVQDVLHEKPAKSLLSPWALNIKGNPGRLPAVRESKAGVQDEGSQLVAAVLAAAPTTSSSAENKKTKKENWLDLCAGPGGKAALLGALAAEQGSHLVANELQEHRARLVAGVLDPIEQAYPGTTTIWCSDGTTVGQDYPQRFDRILVDAPCSGLGVLRRRPEARWRKQESDLDSLLPLQQQLLESAWQALKPGGVLGYSTCSPQVDETKSQVEKFLQAHPQAQLLDAAQIAQDFVSAYSGQDLGVKGPYLNLWPHAHNTDAMFLALFTKPL